MSKQDKKQGWDYITETFEKIYAGQENPIHYGTMISWRFGGEDPLDGISIYDGGDFYHFVTYGFSELYEKESDDKEFSGFGFELTMKLKKSDIVDEGELKCIAGIMQELGRMSFNNGNVFQPYEYIYTGQKEGMDAKSVSKITGFITVPDEEAGKLETPNGKLEFVQLVGMTDKELKLILDKKSSVKEIANKLGHTFTDYSRSDII